MGDEQTFAVFNLQMPPLRLPAEIQLMEGTLKKKKRKKQKTVNVCTGLKQFCLYKNKNKVR